MPERWCILSVPDSLFNSVFLVCRRDLIKWLVSTGEPLLDVTIWSMYFASLREQTKLKRSILMKDYLCLS